MILRIIRRIRYYINLLVRLNIIKTIYFNFKMLPANIAVKLPIYVYGKAKFRELNGRIVINAPIKRGMIKIGKNDYYVRTAVPLTNWVVNGIINFNGSAKLLNGGYLCVSRGATLTFGDGLMIGSNYKIMCFENISIGKTFEMTYDCQIYDTSFHYTEFEDGSKVRKLTKPISIGDYVWVGNTSSIVKGASIPNRAIIAANSLVNKNYTSNLIDENDSGCLIAGVPAKLKIVGVKRIFDKDIENLYDKQFGYDRTHL